MMCRCTGKRRSNEKRTDCLVPVSVGYIMMPASSVLEAFEPNLLPRCCRCLPLHRRGSLLLLIAGGGKANLLLSPPHPARPLRCAVHSQPRVSSCPPQASPHSQHHFLHPCVASEYPSQVFCLGTQL